MLCLNAINLIPYTYGFIISQDGRSRQFVSIWGKTVEVNTKTAPMPLGKKSEILYRSRLLTVENISRQFTALHCRFLSIIVILFTILLLILFLFYIYRQKGKASLRVYSSIQATKINIPAIQFCNQVCLLYILYV